MTGTLRLVLLALGVVLGDVALGLILHGAALAVAYSATLVIAGAVAWRVPRDPGNGELLLATTLCGQALLAAGHALGVAPPDLALDGSEGAAAVLAAHAVASGAVCAGRLVAPRREGWSAALDALALAALAYLTAVLLDGAWVAAAWAALAALILPFARRDHVAAGGAVGLLALAVCHVLAFEMPPVALVDGLDDVLGAVLAVGALAAAAIALGLARIVDPSTLLRADVAPPAETEGVGTAAPRSRSAGHGVRSLRAPLVGLAGLAALYRVASFLALGLVLLGGAFLWQRARPPQPG
ncbi:MAG: hypothetical protein MSC31_08110 [Solirubrobacteraceae bacterium MAG38_C4-C5]|nr:hypothetical protein [Candidatus Siliceabacter maunaloa]